VRFEDAVEVVLKHEGGYVFHPKDPGGETNFGISKRSYPTLDIKNLTIKDAVAIYKKDFWDALQIDALPFSLRLVVFDAAVNQGPGAAIGMLQGILGVKVDGVLGPVTLSKLNQVDETKLFQKYCAQRLQRYFQTRGFSHFGAGWIRRLLDVSILAAKCLGSNGR